MTDVFFKKFNNVFALIEHPLRYISPPQVVAGRRTLRNNRTPGGSIRGNTVINLNRNAKKYNRGPGGGSIRT